MKKIIVLMLVVALCVPALFSCAFINKFFDKTLDNVAEMYSNSAPTKVVATTKQTIASVELNSRYELITGFVDDKSASVYTETVESLRTIDDGGNTDEIKSLIKTTDKKIEAVQGYGARTNGGEWNPNGNVWTIGRGSMALNLDDALLENVVYENNTLTFTVAAENAGAVLGEEYSDKITGTVEVTIKNDGAVITSIDLHYFLAGDAANNLVESEMTVSVVYSYDIEKITIE